MTYLFFELLSRGLSKLVGSLTLFSMLVHPQLTESRIYALSLMHSDTSVTVLEQSSIVFLIIQPNQKYRLFGDLNKLTTRIDSFPNRYMQKKNWYIAPLEQLLSAEELVNNVFEVWGHSKYAFYFFDGPILRKMFKIFWIVGPFPLVLTQFSLGCLSKVLLRNIDIPSSCR